MTTSEYIVGDPAEYDDLVKFAARLAVYRAALQLNNIPPEAINLLLVNYQDHIIRLSIAKQAQALIKERPPVARVEIIYCDFCTTAAKRRGIHLVRRNDTKLAYACEAHAEEVIKAGGTIVSSESNDNDNT